MPRQHPEASDLVEALLSRMDAEKLNVSETARLIGISPGSLYQYTFSTAKPAYKNARLIAAWLKMPLKSRNPTVQENLRAMYGQRAVVATIREILDYLAAQPGGEALVDGVKNGEQYKLTKERGYFSPQ